MNGLVIDDPCLMFALGRESRWFRREFKPNQAFPGAPCWARFCGPAWLAVFVVATGVGKACTERFLDWLATRPALEGVAYRPRLILSGGFCGALRESLHVGDVVLATEVMAGDGDCLPTTWPGELPPGPWRPPLHRGRIVTADHLVAEHSEKQKLGSDCGALAVDMEAATVARWCRQQEIPFGCVRAVSDDARTSLSPSLAQIMSGGRISWSRLLVNLVRRPTFAVELWRLSRATRLAAQQLGLALGELLTLTLPAECR